MRTGHRLIVGPTCLRATCQQPLTTHVIAVNITTSFTFNAVILLTGPGNGSPTAANVVVVAVVVVVVVVGILLLWIFFKSTKTFPFLNRS